MSIHDLEPRYTIREATIKDCDLINSLAWEAFPATYQAILTPEQIEYMMHWMYDGRRARVLYYICGGRAGRLCVREAGGCRSVPFGENLCFA